VGREAITDDDGVFIATGLSSQAYVVRIAPESLNEIEVLDGGAEEFNTVDRDFEAAAWPSIPMPVQPGATANVGTITLRSLSYYRARVHFRGECKVGEKWLMALVKLPYNNRAGENRMGGVACRSQFLIRDIAPGSYMLALWTGKENTRWSLTPLVIGSQNVEATVDFSPSAELTAGIVVPSGVATPRLADVSLQLRPEDAPDLGKAPPILDDDGRFSFHNVVWPRQSLTIQGVPRSHYIKEIRYAGQPVREFAFAVSNGGRIEIVLDDHPATIKGKVAGLPTKVNTLLSLSFVSIARVGYRGSPMSEPFAYRTAVRSDGSFELGGLAPGEYRISASQRLERDGTDDGALIRIGMGETKTVEVKLQ
jgi:hypothetical protein